ncbi:MAG: hypothetical protein ABIW76_01455 [Fibrobacteria bacterium]
MINRLFFGLLWLAGSAAQAQTVNLRGKVSNEAGQAVAGAVVELAVMKLKDTTGSDGMYSLSGSVGIGHQASLFTERMALNGSVLELFLSRSQAVEIEVYNVRGNLIKREALANASAGAHRWNLSENASPDNMLVIKASVGGQTRTFHYLPLVGAGYAAQSPASGDAPMAAALAKSAADVDTLIVTASGFTSKKTPLSSYDAMVDVALSAVSVSGGYPLKNEPVKSAGCGKPATITSSINPAYRTIMSGGASRQYVIDLPKPYDMNKPYRFIMGSHGAGGEGNDIQREKYYSIQEIPEAASSAIFVSASGSGGSWGAKDVQLYNDILDFVKNGACVDESRTFVLGFSFGGMYSYSLSVTSQKTVRAGIGMSPANFNITLPPKVAAPIAWMQSTGMSDGTCPWVRSEASKQGSKFIAQEIGALNGCTVPDPIPTWKSGSMLCNDFVGCKPGYPTRVCTFGGGHSLPFTSNHAATGKWMWDFITLF